MLTSKAPALKAKMNGFPAVNRGMGGMLRRQAGSRGFINGGNINATPAMATVKSLRSDGTLAGLFLQDASWSIFGSHLAGEFIQIDFGTSVPVTTVTYRNGPGSSWAPYTAQVQSSQDGVNWTTEADHTDNGSTVKQTISITTNKKARYWRLYQNSNTRGNSSGNEWHFNCFAMIATNMIEI